MAGNVPVQRVGSVTYSREQFAQFAYRAGFRGLGPSAQAPGDLVKAVAISYRESAGGGVYIVGAPNGGPSHEWSFGVAGLNWLSGEPFLRRIGITDPHQLLDPQVSFNAFRAMQQADGWVPWGPYKHISELDHTDPAAAYAAVQHAIATGMIPADAANGPSVPAPANALTGAGTAPSSTPAGGTVTTAQTMAATARTRPKQDPNTDLGPGPFPAINLIYELVQAGVTAPAEVELATAVALAVAGEPDAADPSKLVPFVMMYASSTIPGPSGLGWFSLTPADLTYLGGYTAADMRAPRKATQAAVRLVEKRTQGPTLPGAKLPRNWLGVTHADTQHNWPEAQRVAKTQVAPALANFAKTFPGAAGPFNPWDQNTWDAGGATPSDPLSGILGAIGGVANLFAEPLKAIVAFFRLITAPELWVRIGMIGAGLVALYFGARYLFRDLSPAPEEHPDERGPHPAVVKAATVAAAA